MICYLDRTFCGSPNCRNECGAKLTPEDAEKARQWWLEVTKGRDDGAPIAYSNFCDDDGCYYNDKRESVHDLFMAPVKKTYWINVYRNASGNFSTGLIYENEAMAKNEHNGSYHYVKTVSFEVEE